MPSREQDDKPILRATRKRALSVAFASVVVFAVAVVSFLPGRDKHRLHTSGRFHSLGHLLVFSVVGFVLARTTHSRRTRIILFIGALMLGLAIEWGEHLVFKSPLEWKDVLVDGFGVVCGTLLAAIITLPEPV
jgi:hypothetical protein